MPRPEKMSAKPPRLVDWAGKASGCAGGCCWLMPGNEDWAVASGTANGPLIYEIKDLG